MWCWGQNGEEVGALWIVIGEIDWELSTQFISEGETYICVTMGSSPDKGWDRLKAGEVWFEIGNDESNDLHNWPSGLVWDQGREVSGEPWFVIWDDIDNYQPSWLQEKRGSVWEVIKIMPKYGRIFRLRLSLCKIVLWKRVLQSSIQLGCSGKASKGLKN